MGLLGCKFTGSLWLFLISWNLLIKLCVHRSWRRETQDFRIKLGFSFYPQDLLEREKQIWTFSLFYIYNDKNKYGFASEDDFKGCKKRSLELQLAVPPSSINICCLECFISKQRMSLDLYIWAVYVKFSKKV